MSTKGSAVSTKTHFEIAHSDFKNECKYIYDLVREQMKKVIDTYSTEDYSKIETAVVDAHIQLSEIYTQELPVLGYTIMNVSDSNPYWSYHYYSERYTEAKRRLFNGIQCLDRMKVEEFTWEMEGCFLALRIMGKME